MKTNDRLPNEHRVPDFAPERIADLLTLAAEQLDADTAEALRSSRQTALARQAVDVRKLSIVSGNSIHFPISHSARHWVVILLVAAVTVSAGYWQHLQQHERMANLDVAILTDDIPMEVFVDR